MKSGKSAALVACYKLWPTRTTRFAFSFQKSGPIESRTEESIPCTHVKSFLDIDFSSIRQAKSDFPTLLLFDECQRADAQNFGQFLEQATWNNCKVVLAGIPSNLCSEIWKFIGYFRNLAFRLDMKIHGQCEICGEVSPDQTAQLRSRPEMMFLDQLAPKELWITCCNICATRYFPFVFVANRHDPGKYYNDA